MRRPLIAGNWKMNLTREQSRNLATAIAMDANTSRADVVLCPPAIYLETVLETARSIRTVGNEFGIGAQNVYDKPNGAFTGEISTAMLEDLGIGYVILGHSERRQFMHESDDVVNAKLKTVLASSLTPIVCVGETLEEREAGRTLEVVGRQFEGAFAGVSEGLASRAILAYEPVWAIGTGKTATPEQAQEVHHDLRKLAVLRYNSALGDSLRILYGGSVKADNAAELLSQADIDGALVGGASLQADTFLKIIAAAG
jgi:triosephosphate isomerase (TIM)